MPRLDRAIFGSGVFGRLNSPPASEISALLHRFDAPLFGLGTCILPPYLLHVVRRKPANAPTGLEPFVSQLGKLDAFLLQVVETNVAQSPFDVQVHAIDEILYVQLLYKERAGELHKGCIGHAVPTSLHVVLHRRVDEPIRRWYQDEPEVIALEAEAGERMTQRAGYRIRGLGDFVLVLVAVVVSKEKIAGCLELVVWDTKIPLLREISV